MGRKTIIFFSLAILLLISISHAAVIQGNVYDSYLNRQADSIVEINTKPAQRFVVKDGSYSFNVPKGTYQITASYTGQNELLKDSITVEVEEEGKYTVDLIMFPTTEEEEQILNETDMNIGDISLEQTPYYIYIIYAAIAAAAVYIIYRIASKKKKKKPAASEEDDAVKVLKFIKKQGGRATQKGIRKEFPLSEAKISLIVADLEYRDKVRKIKKGRGNIIILKK